MECAQVVTSNPIFKGQSLIMQTNAVIIYC